jgi:hypothetical protein
MNNHHKTLDMVFRSDPGQAVVKKLVKGLHAEGQIN